MNVSGTRPGGLCQPCAKVGAGRCGLVPFRSPGLSVDMSLKPAEKLVLLQGFEPWTSPLPRRRAASISAAKSTRYADARWSCASGVPVIPHAAMIPGSIPAGTSFA